MHGQAFKGRHANLQRITRCVPVARGAIKRLTTANGISQSITGYFAPPAQMWSCIWGHVSKKFVRANELSLGASL
jgi:hypothetical protein